MMREAETAEAEARSWVFDQTNLCSPAGLAAGDSVQEARCGGKPCNKITFCNPA